MKKLPCILMGTAILAAAAFGISACGDPKGGEGETKFSFAGDLQTLYGGENGYPQAVLVAKTSIIENDPAAVARITKNLAAAHDYLADAEPTAVVAALSSAYASGLAPSFNANNLNAQVIENCSVRFTPAAEGKAEINSYLTALHELDANFIKKVPEDAFYYTETASEGIMSATYSVYAPDGAPALALAYALSQTEETDFSYHIIAANTIPAQVTGASPAADFCILPVNAAANALGSGETYKLLGTVTHGNMYLLSTNTALPVITTENLSALKGKRVGVVQLANVPGLTLRLALANAGIAYKVVADEANDPDAVNLVAVADATQVTLAGNFDYFLCPEPAAGAKVAATANK